MTASLEVGPTEALGTDFRQKGQCSESDRKLQATVPRDAEWHAQSLCTHRATAVSVASTSAQFMKGYFFIISHLAAHW